MERALKILGKGAEEITVDPRAAPWKVAVAGLLKHRLSSANAWLGARLGMGVEFGVSRYVTEMIAGKRPAAEKLYHRLTARIK